MFRNKKMKELYNWLYFKINKGSHIIPLHNENNSNLNIFNKLVINHAYKVSDSHEIWNTDNNLDSRQFVKINQDAKQFTKDFLTELVSIGSYSDSSGVESVKRNVLNKLNKKNNTNQTIDDIYLTEGVSNSLSKIFSIFFHDSSDVILWPKIDKGYYKEIVEYKKGTYELYEYDEDNNWDIDLEQVKQKVEELKMKKLNPKGILISNPCNPCGNIFSEKQIKKIINFCYENNLIIISDESLYQNECYKNTFFSFSKVLNNFNNEIKNNQEIIIVNSLRFGFYKIPGLNSGFINLINIDNDVKLQIKKFLGINLNPNLTGQLVLNLWANDFNKSKYSSETLDYISNYRNEKMIIKENKISTINKFLKNSKYFSQNKIQTDYFLFTKFSKLKDDFEFCKKLLQEKNVLIVPGSIFFNKYSKDNTYLRITLNQKLDFIIEGLERIESQLDKY